MPFLDKSDVLKSLGLREQVIVDLGCGPRKRHVDAIGVDVIDHDAVDLVGDAIEVLDAFPDDVIDGVYSCHFFEHLSEMETIVDLLARKVKPGGRIEIVVPHFSNAYFYSDPTHKISFGLYTFCYFCKSDLFRRKVPSYVLRPQLRLVKVDLVFKASRPFYLRYLFRKCLGYVFNSSTFFKELYEDCFPFLFPCYEVRYVVERLPERGFPLPSG